MHSLELWVVFIVVAAWRLEPRRLSSRRSLRPTTREAAIEQAQAEKVETLHPYVPGKVEALLNRAEDILVNGVPRWHPFFESAYYGGGFTLGAGYAHHVSPYNLLDVRGSYTILGYKRVEAEFTAPRLFHRRGSLVAPRRLARGDTSGLLWHRDGHVERRSHGLRFPAAVRVGHS